VTAAFAYLTVCSIRNGARLRLRRLRRPRYLMTALGLIVYAGSMLWSRPAAGVLAIPPAYRESSEIAAPIIATLLLGLAWVLPNSLALAFTLAEVHLLFPAPITRRQLIGYKLSRLLFGAVGTSLLLTLFVAPPRLLLAAGFAGRSFVILAIMTLYQTGVAMYRKSAEQRVGLPGARSIAVMAAALVITPAAGWVVARLALGEPHELVYTLPLAAALFAACWLWILQSDAAFEEAAAESAEKVRLTGLRGAQARPRLRSNRSSAFRLAPHGPLETAILWKNWMLLSRPSRGAVLAGTVLFVSLFAGVWFSADAAPGRGLVGFLSFIIAGIVALMGPAMLRVDLRQDLAHLAMIKTWPVRGAAVFRGELLAPLIALSLAAALPILLGAALDDKMMLDAGASLASRAQVAFAASLVATSLVLALLVIHNGIAVVFPAWVRVIPGAGVGGMEVMGQTMVTLYGGLFALMLAVIPPAVAAGAAWFFASGSWAAWLAPAAVFAAVLGLECLVATELLGRVLDRTDLQDVAVVE
jgi:hypothetical protein